MEKLRESATVVVNNIQSFVAEFVREKQNLDNRASHLAGLEAGLKERETALEAVERSDKVSVEQETRKEELLKMQSEISRDFEANEREARALSAAKETWLKQRASDQQGIDNERADIRKQNAELAKAKAEYKDKVLKQLKTGVAV